MQQDLNKLLIRRENIKRIQQVLLGLIRQQNENVDPQDIYQLIDEINLILDPKEGYVKGGNSGFKGATNMRGTGKIKKGIKSLASCSSVNKHSSDLFNCHKTLKYHNLTNLLFF